MRKRSRYKFRLSISREGYENLDAAKTCCGKLKEAKAIGHHRIAFKEFDVTVSEFLEYAIKGYAFCHLFQFDVNNEYKFETSKPTWNGEKEFEAFPIYKKGVNKGYFKVQFKSDKFFHSAQAVFLDMEIRNDARKTKYQSIDECVSLLKKKPTCAFYSYSDKIKEDIASRRFQLVYVFDSILNKDEFETMTYKIYHMIEKETREVLVGLSVRSSGFLIGGNNPHVYNSSIIYSVNDFNDDTDIAEYLSILNQKPEVSSDPNEIRFAEELVRDMQTLLYPNVEQKWEDKGLEYILSTPIDFGDKYYKIPPKDYVQLEFIKKRLRDGQHRRYTLFLRAARRRLIKPNITADELLYNLYKDRELVFDNSDGALSIRVLQECVKAALQTDIDSIRELNSRSKKSTYKVNPNIPDKRKMRGKARTEITDRKIAKMYDVNMSVKDNLTHMAAKGIKIGKSRLYQWRKKNNITPIKKPVIEGYNPDLTIEENIAAMKCTKYQVEKAKKAYLKSIKK
ncbi:MAG: hypothetical protein MR794_06250 [Bacteroidales bacterium]|nr:hypothetical protein [Bacteroidales bacterium]